MKHHAHGHPIESSRQRDKRLKAEHDAKNAVNPDYAIAKRYNEQGHDDLNDTPHHTTTEANNEITKMRYMRASSYSA